MIHRTAITLSWNGQGSLMNVVPEEIIKAGVEVRVMRNSGDGTYTFEVIGNDNPALNDIPSSKSDILNLCSKYGLVEVKDYPGRPEKLNKFWRLADKNGKTIKEETG